MNRNYKYCTTHIMKRWFEVLSSLIHHVMSIAAVMQLFTCPFDNDTSHVQLYLTLGMLLCGMTHICFHRNRRFQCGLCNWIWWICPFLDNGAVQPRGHQRALTPCWPMLQLPFAAAGWSALAEFSTSCSLPLTQSNFSCIFVPTCVCVFLCTSGAHPKAFGIQFGSRPLLHLLLSDISSSSCSLHPNSSHNLHPPTAPTLPFEEEPCLFPFISPLYCAQQQSRCISKHFI